MREVAAIVLWAVAVVTCIWKARAHRQQLAAATTKRAEAWHVGMVALWLSWLVLVTLLLATRFI